MIFFLIKILSWFLRLLLLPSSSKNMYVHACHGKPFHEPKNQHWAMYNLLRFGPNYIKLNDKFKINIQQMIFSTVSIENYKMVVYHFNIRWRNQNLKKCFPQLCVLKWPTPVPPRHSLSPPPPPPRNKPKAKQNKTG